jgi:hypothetical protein
VAGVRASDSSGAITPAPADPDETAVRRFDGPAPNGPAPTPTDEA